MNIILEVPFATPAKYQWLSLGREHDIIDSKRQVRICRMVVVLLSPDDEPPNRVEWLRLEREPDGGVKYVTSAPEVTHCSWCERMDDGSRFYEGDLSLVDVDDTWLQGA